MKLIIVFRDYDSEEITIPWIMKSINSIEKLYENNKHERLLNTFNNEKKLSNEIDKILKRLIIESIHGCGEECGKRAEKNIPNEATKTSVIHTDNETVLPNRASKPCLIQKKVKKNPKISLSHKNANTPVQNKAHKTLVNSEVDRAVPNKALKIYFMYNDVTTAFPDNATKISYNKNSETPIPNKAFKTYLTGFNATPQKHAKAIPPKKYSPIASIITYPSKLPVQKIDTKTSPITALFPTKEFKHNLVEIGLDPIQEMFPNNDELRHFQQANLSQILNIVPVNKFDPLYTEKSQKVFVVSGQQTSPRGNEEAQARTPKKTKSPTERRQVNKTTSTANPTVLQKQQTAEKGTQISKTRCQNQNTQTTAEETLKIISSHTHEHTQHSSPAFKKIERDTTEQVNNIQNGETSFKIPIVQTGQHIGTSKSKAGPPDYASSVNVSRIKECTSGELVVIKEPDEWDCDEDNFIPPFANKSYAVDPNISNVYALDEDTESDANNGAVIDFRKDLAEAEEVSDSATNLSKFSYIDRWYAESADITTSQLYSKHGLPTNPSADSTLSISEFSNDSRSILRMKVPKRFRSNHGELYLPEFSDLGAFQNFDQYCCSNEFDEALNQVQSKMDDFLNSFQNPCSSNGSE